MKILSWNVNGLRARLDAVNRIIETINPDIMCFQKVRTKGSMFITIPGYMGWLGPMEDGLFGGVSTYIKDGFNLEFEKQGIPIPEWLLNTTCISVLNLDEFYLVNAYFPYANAANEDFIKTRQRWDYELHDFIVKLSGRKPVVMCGDLNIVAEDIDAWDGISVKNAGCFFPWEHRNFDSMLNAAGLVDSYRHLNPDKREYTYFFQNQPEYRQNNQGHRIDYFLVSEEIMPNVIQSTIMTDVTDTDSSPILLEIE